MTTTNNNLSYNEILKQAAEQGASDVHLKVGVVPVIRKLGVLRPLSQQAFPLVPEQMEKIVQEALSQEEIKTLAEKFEVDKSYEIKNVARFRVNVFRQRNSTRFVIRLINQTIPNFETLQLPGIIKRIAESERGLILVTGVTGSGKSTTLASMINHINLHQHTHIVTLEDPIEYLIKDRKSIVSQRELGVDMTSFAQALRASLRQDPDVILVGEMRDQETTETAILAAETGHLVFSTLHTLDAQETINRIIGLFPPYQQDQVRRQLAGVLRAIVCQRLILRKDGEGMIPALEILVNNQRIKELIEDPERTNQITEAIALSAKDSGMRTFDQSLMRLVAKNIISVEEATKYASNRDNFLLKLKGIQSGAMSDWDEDRNQKGVTAEPTWAADKSNLQLENKKSKS
jgi:twitching motility protein PilT